VRLLAIRPSMVLQGFAARNRRNEADRWLWSWSEGWLTTCDLLFLLDVLALRSYRKRTCGAFLALAMVATIQLLSGCRSSSHFDTAHNLVGCLPDITLVDQNGKNVSLVSLKGKPALLDFIYTTCPGPCLRLTQRIRAVAEALGATLGPKATILSISIDPARDGPGQMLAYANKQDANRSGWLFLTGTLADVDSVLASFKLSAARKPDGTVEHVVAVFLLGADGCELHEYNGEVLKADAVSAEIRRAEARQVRQGNLSGESLASDF